MAKWNPIRSKAPLAAGVALATAGFLTLIYFGTFMAMWHLWDDDDELFSYSRIDAHLDKNTNAVVELGLLESFSATILVVGVYQVSSIERRVKELRNTLLELTIHAEIPTKLEFDGTCYFVQARYNNFNLHIAGRWTDPHSGNDVCFYLLTPEQRRYP